MLYNGEHIGDGSPPEVDIAVDPLEGTELCANGLPNAIATIALSERGTMFDPGPCVYMLKMATSRSLAHVLDLDRPIGETLKLMAKEKGVPVGDLVVIMLDRPRHEEYMREIREAGGRIRLIPHGDVSAALAAVTEDSTVDLLFGIGGTPEGVLAAAAIQCTGGQILGRLWPRTDEERKRGARGRLRPRRGARQGPARVGQARLLRRHRGDGRRDARRRALQAARGAPPPSRSRCAPAPAPCAASPRATTAPSCARSPASGWADRRLGGARAARRRATAPARGWPASAGRRASRSRGCAAGSARRSSG